MANEIQYRAATTGSTLYAVVHDARGYYWTGTAWETLTNAHWATYVIALAEAPAGSYRYEGDFPGVGVGAYTVEVYLQAGGSPAQTDTILAQFAASWSGTPVALSPAATDFNLLTAGKMLQLMAPLFGLKSKFGVLRRQEAQSIIIQAAQEIWHKRPWHWRRVSDYTLTTVANQKYVAVPTDYDQCSINHALHFSPPGGLGEVAYVRPDAFSSRADEYQSAGRPVWFTDDNATISGVAGSPAFLFAPIPDAIYTLTGLVYYRLMPALDFTDSKAVFPKPQFDILWRTRVVSMMSLLGEAVHEKAVSMYPLRKDAYESLAREMESAWAPHAVDVTNRVPQNNDVYRDGERAASYWMGWF
jgi:hypothetical protein